MSSLVSPASLKYAGMSAGVWFATAYGLNLVLGGEASVTEIAIDAGLMGASCLASDLVQGQVLGSAPTPVTSAVGTGLMYAALQAAYRGSDGYVTNFALAGANDYLTQMVAPAN